ncbi:hypothetical protein [Amycolatopsis samaneae]|uniref:DUF1772 domain-containing protein n=1 Tax=Amycolatopsis samaneae TaxID=664691 RepID=A0ABW5GQF9_9PSEU
MTQTFAEVLILTVSALGVGVLMFVTGVIQPVMNAMDETAFKRFLPALYHHAIRSVFAVSVSLVTFVAMIPYFIFYGFDHWWFIAGLIVFTISSVVSKILNLPIYRKVPELPDEDTAGLREQRRKLTTANFVRAALGFVSVALMTIQLAGA